MGLRDYENKRDFSRTPEPRGRRPAARPEPGGRFVVQKHSARRLHYDVRIEMNGVLVSWAVPKGPSLDPREKRLAVQTEDHPLEYGDFEGVIPEGNYGAGTVMIWDRGLWGPMPGHPLGSLEEGKLKISLNGGKLRGGFTLVRIKSGRDAGERNWLLIKERDAEARDENEYSVTAEAPYSAVTGRTLRQISDQGERIWLPGVAPELQTSGKHDVVDPPPRRTSSKRPKNALRVMRPKIIPDSPGAPVSAPEGDDWLHELLIEGRRGLLSRAADAVELRLDTPLDAVARRAPAILNAARLLPPGDHTLDGVLTVLDAAGRSDAAALEQALRGNAAHGLVFIAFDLIRESGEDVSKLPLLQRKERLRALLPTADAPVRYADHIVGSGNAVCSQARRLGAAGVVSKRVASRYAPRRSGDWRLIRFEFPSGKPISDVRANPDAPRPEPVVEFSGVRLSNPDRILYPEERVTKRMLADYYERVADWILPHLVDRPLSLYRCPLGHEGDCWFQKHLGDLQTPHLREAPVRAGEGKEPYIQIVGKPGLLTLAQLAVLEIHPWGCRADDVAKPDRMIFDLDPGPGVEWPQVVEAAMRVKMLLDELGLRSFVKTSGGKGLHVVVPLVRRHDWDGVKGFAAGVAKRLARENPKRFTATLAKWAREGRVFIDYLRNVRGATCVGAYSTRARPGAAVSMPLAWEELGPRPTVYTILSAPHRLEGLLADPWGDMPALRQSLTRAMHALLERI